MKPRELLKDWRWGPIGLGVGLFSIIILANVLWWPLGLLNLSLVIVYFLPSWSKRFWFWSGGLLAQIIFLGPTFFPVAVLSLLALALWRLINIWPWAQSFLVSGLSLYILIETSLILGGWLFRGFFYPIKWQNLLLEISFYMVILFVVRYFKGRIK